MKVIRFILDLISIIVFGIMDVLYCIVVLIGYENITFMNGLGVFASGILLTYVIILLGKDIASILDLKNNHDITS